MRKFMLGMMLVASPIFACDDLRDLDSDGYDIAYDDVPSENQIDDSIEDFQLGA